MGFYMKINLNWDTKYNLYMKHKNENDIQSLFNELKQYSNFNIESEDVLEKALEHWGEYYIKNIKFRSANWFDKYINSIEESEAKVKRLNDPSKDDLTDKQKQKRIEELEEIIRIKDDYIEWLKKHNLNSKRMAFKYIHLNKASINLPIKMLCSILNVSYEGYRKWVLNGCNVEPKYNEEWLKVILKAFKESNENFGRPRLLYYLKVKYGLTINDNTLFRYMRKLGIKSKTKKWKGKNPPKEYKFTKNEIPNLIESNFKTTEPNRKWFIDETYIDLPKGEWLYLCAIVDSYNNEVVGYQIADYRDKWIALDALTMAIKNRDTSNVILHSDRGAIYQSHDFTKMCKENLITQSMNDKAVSTQNRPIEFLFSVFKCEYLRLLPTKERSLNKLIKFVCAWVEHYNYIRFQPCLGWKTPKEFG